MTITEPPTTLYLQLRDDDGELLDPEDQTWSPTPIYKHDAVYVLKPPPLPDPPCNICGGPINNEYPLGEMGWEDDGPIFTHRTCADLSPRQLAALKSLLKGQG